MTFRTRFAPSPSGPLHLGHAYSAMLAHDMARSNGGEFLLRIEDIDQQRSKPKWEQLIYEDLSWLGLTWDAPPMRQSERLPAYRQALEKLWQDDLLFRCTCSRSDIQQALSAPQEGDIAHGPDGAIYPGTCRVHDGSSSNIPLPDNSVLRLDINQMVRSLNKDEVLGYDETGRAPHDQTERRNFSIDQLPKEVGDVALARRDMGTSYHLSVVLDDAMQNITHVVRGSDLESATQIHVALQTIFDLPTPTYHHHRLIRDEAGKRLAKRDNARAIFKYREEGATPSDIRRMVGM